MLFWSLPLQIPVSVLIEFFLLIWFTFYYLFSSFVHLYWSLNIVYNEQWEMRESFLFGFAHFPEHWKLSFTWTLGWGQFIQNSPRAESSGSQAAVNIFGTFWSKLWLYISSSYTLTLIKISFASHELTFHIL